MMAMASTTALPEAMRGADVFILEVFDFFCWRAGQERGEFLCVGGDDVQFG